jgi:hypothetical protein
VARTRAFQEKCFNAVFGEWLLWTLNTEYVSSVQESGEPEHSSSAPVVAVGPSGRGGTVKGSDTVVHVGESGRRCCGMSDPLLAATLIGESRPPGGILKMIRA